MKLEAIIILYSLLFYLNIIKKKKEIWNWKIIHNIIIINEYIFNLKLIR